MNRAFLGDRRIRFDFGTGVYRHVCAFVSAVKVRINAKSHMKTNAAVLIANSLGEAWHKFLSKALQEGDWVRDGEHDLLEIRNVMAVIADVSKNDPIILNYADRHRILLMHQKYTSCNIVPPYQISYGKLLFDNNDIDQIEWVIQRLLKKRETKSATISLHIPGVEELSCLSMLDFKIRNAKLTMTAVYRSQNIFASLPGNLLVLRSIQEDIAERTACQAGEVILLPISAHIYATDLKRAEETVNAIKKIC